MSSTEVTPVVAQNEGRICEDCEQRCPTTKERDVGIVCDECNNWYYESSSSEEENESSSEEEEPAPDDCFGRGR